MNLVRYEPWSLFNRLSRDLDRLFAAQLENDEARSVVADWIPAVDIKEEEKQFVLRADLPGVDPKDIDITMEGGVLTIRGRRETEAREDRDGYRRVERVKGEFFRRFNLPDTANAEGIKARSVNGVLEVTIPKQPSVLPRRIKVEAH